MNKNVIATMGKALFWKVHLIATTTVSEKDCSGTKNVIATMEINCLGTVDLTATVTVSKKGLISETTKLIATMDKALFRNSQFDWNNKASERLCLQANV